MTTPLPFTWPYCLVFWLIYVWVFIPEYRKFGRAVLSTPAPAEDRGSRPVVLAGFGLAIVAAFLLSFVAHQATLPGSRTAWFFIGVIALISGGLLRRHCFRVLGTYFTGAVTIQADHRVIETGAYRWVRHPNYSAVFVELIALPLIHTAWITAIAAAIGNA